MCRSHLTGKRNVIHNHTRLTMITNRFIMLIWNPENTCLRHRALICPLSWKKLILCKARSEIMDRWTQDCTGSRQNQFGIAVEIYMTSADPNLFSLSEINPSSDYQLRAFGLLIISEIRLITEYLNDLQILRVCCMQQWISSQGLVCLSMEVQFWISL